MWGVGTPYALKTTIITTIMNPIKGNKKDEEKKIINEAADYYAFMMKNLGMKIK